MPKIGYKTGESVLVMGVELELSRSVDMSV